MPYETDGSLTTDKRVIDDSDSWASQSEWEAYQSASSVEIVSGAVQLAEITQPDIGEARWTFDSEDTESGTAIDSWGSYDASIVGGVTTGVAGLSDTYDSGEAYELNGSDGHLEAPSVFDSSPFVWAGWVEISSTGQQAIFDQQSLFTLWYDRDGNNQLQIATYGSSQDLEQLSVGSSYFIYIYWDSVADEVGYSIDGSAITTVDLSDAVDSTTQSTWFGASDGAQNALDGTIDDFRVYGVPLTDQEVTDLYNTGSIL